MRLALFWYGWRRRPSKSLLDCDRNGDEVAWKLEPVRLPRASTLILKDRSVSPILHQAAEGHAAGARRPKPATRSTLPPALRPPDQDPRIFVKRQQEPTQDPAEDKEVYLADLAR